MMKMIKAALLATTLIGGSAQAAVLAPGVWTTFFFEGDGSTLVDVDTNDTSYTFSLSAPTLLKITDAFVIGDVFQLTINGVLQDPTGPFDLDGPFTDDPDVAYAGTTYSHAGYLLGPGDYTVTGIALLSPTGGGGAFIQLAGAVPEPATWGLMIAGFGLVGVAARRRRTTVTA